MGDKLKTESCEVVQNSTCEGDGEHVVSPLRKENPIVDSLHSAGQSVSSQHRMDNDTSSPKLAHKTLTGCDGESSGGTTKSTRKLSLLSRPFKHTMRERSGFKALNNRVPKKSTILEQSKHDWESFKSCEGLNEELQNYNRGKHGFIERQEFLQRTDQRQFEIERKLRSKLK